MLSLVRRHWQNDGFARPRAGRRLAGAGGRSGSGSTWPTSKQRRPRAPEPRGVERTVAARTSVLAISGRVDRIDERDGELVIVDYKSGRAGNSTPATQEGPSRFALYAMAAERTTMHQRCRIVELHSLRTGHIAAFEHTDASLQQHLGRAEQTATDIIAAQDTVAGGADRNEVFEPNRPVLQMVRLPVGCPERAFAGQTEPGEPASV